MTQDRVRVLRVIEYIGPRDWIEKQVAASIHGTKDLGQGRLINVATIGAYPEILESCKADEGKAE